MADAEVDEVEGVVSEETLRKRWGDFTVTVDFVEGPKAMEFISAEGKERTVYFHECDLIDFKDLKGANIWSTSGTGEMKLPADVAVVVIRGKSIIRD